MDKNTSSADGGQIGLEILDTCTSVFSLSQALEKKAERELMEKPEWRARDIQALREMLQEEPNLIVPSDDNFLLRFLRARKFDYDRAFRLIKQYYILRDNNPELFKDFVPSALKDVFSANLEGFLQHRDREGHAIFVIRGGIWDPAKHSANDIYRANLLCLEKAIEDPATQINGIIALLDLKEFGFHHIRQMSPAHCRRMVLLIQIHFHGENLQSLHEHIPPSILPAEFGGHLGPFSNQEFVNELLADEYKFQDYLKYGYRAEMTPEGREVGIR
ncbi:alpha-tocopherol transfer protein-like isoform X3 [Tachypleus tridentatus]|uniref:alpha-tocopherol transfer protein-like isoform X3 n=1 Tax=Tachypleus tridentatus TaxID=6853 RepID=UPI003FD3300E